MGVQYITKNRDKQDAYIIRNAFSGLYYIVNAPTNIAVDRIVPSPFKQPPAYLIINNQAPQFKQSQGLFPSIPGYNQPNTGKIYKRDQ